MGLQSYKCKGCTNKCHLSYKGEVGTYCKAIYDPNHKGIEWHGETLVCLDFTTDPTAEDKEIREWSEPMHRKGSTTLDEFIRYMDGFKENVQLRLF